MNFKIRIVTLIILVLFAGKANAQEQAQENKKPLNVILLIGDGMGLSQVSAGLYFQDRSSSFERFPVIGLSKTSSKSHKITDSAAGATALACGEKTYNGAIGVDMGQRSIPNLVEILSKENYATGLIATSSITHATPASFFAHAENRSMDEKIASQMADSEVDFFSGGGLDFFVKRKDGQDLTKELESKGFVISTKEVFKPKSVKPEEKYGMLLANDGMPKMIEGREDFLGKSVETALSYFEQKGQPFFLMIEGSQIDWGGHANNAEYLIGEQIDFDKVIGQVLDFAEKNSNTLVLVTADHETGGFTLSSKNVMRRDSTTVSDYNQIEPTFSNGGHSATMVPVFAFGPYSEVFGGVYENTEIFHKILKSSK